MHSGKLYIRFYQIDDKWQFQLLARNGEAIMTSERYSSQRSMNRAIHIVMTRPRAKEIFKVSKPNKEDI